MKFSGLKAFILFVFIGLACITLAYSATPTPAVSLKTVPEPSVASLVGALGVLFLLRRRRRKG
ncbi:MAG: PEP-CTERM sorting domain-containing protein [Armatimonadetes bacterium]|nr:PEP-CTERM sorting domain-containing protein [Akkermansiaceae bacterium]